MILLNEEQVVVHRVVVFDEYMYLLAMQVGGVRKLTVRATGTDLKVVANKLHDNLPPAVAIQLKVKQNALLGQMMRQGEACLNVK